MRRPCLSASPGPRVSHFRRLGLPISHTLRPEPPDIPDDWGKHRTSPSQRATAFWQAAAASSGRPIYTNNWPCLSYMIARSLWRAGSAGYCELSLSQIWRNFFKLRSAADTSHGPRGRHRHSSRSLPESRQFVETARNYSDSAGEAAPPERDPRRAPECCRCCGPLQNSLPPAENGPRQDRLARWGRHFVLPPRLDSTAPPLPAAPCATVAARVRRATCSG